MTPAVLLPLLLAVQAEPRYADPALRLDVWPRHFVRYGDRVNVTVDTDRDGFLTVLRVDTYGRMHVLFPYEPTDEGFVEAGERVRLYDAYGDFAFAAFEREGEGVVLAALSEERYDFSPFMSGGRWSYPLMGERYVGVGNVQVMRDFVSHAAGTDRFAEAVAYYWVSTRRSFAWNGRYSSASCFGYGRFSPWIGYGSGWSGAFHYGYDNPFYYGYDDPFYSSYGCYGGYFYPVYPRRIVIVSGPPGGLPVDRNGFRRKKGDIVPPSEPRRRGADSAGTVGRIIDLRPRARPQGDHGAGRVVTGRDRTILRPQEPADRRRSDARRDNDRPQAPDRRRSDAQRDNDTPARREPPSRPSIDRPAPPPPQRPAVARPTPPPPPRPAADRPAPPPKPAEKPKN